MRKEFNCNGSIEQNEQYGEIIQLQGDQRDNIAEWLVVQEILTKQEAIQRIVKHG
jgi:translation initiation factor 1